MAWSSRKNTRERASLGGGNGQIWKKRGTIGVPAPTGQGVATASQAPQVVAANGVTNRHAPAEIRPRANGCRTVPQRPAATNHAAWEIRGATDLATQASFILTPPSQPASSCRGTIFLRTAWIALCPPLRRVARAALPPPFALHFHAHARISIHASGSRSCRQLAGPSPHAAGLPCGGGHDPVRGGIAATRIRPFDRYDVRPHRSGAGAIPSHDSRVWFERSGAGGVRRS